MVSSGASENPLQMLMWAPWSQLCCRLNYSQKLAQKHTDPIGTSAPRSEGKSLSGTKALSQVSEDSGGRRPGVAHTSPCWVWRKSNLELQVLHEMSHRLTASSAMEVRMGSRTATPLQSPQPHLPHLLLTWPQH